MRNQIYQLQQGGQLQCQTEIELLLLSTKEMLPMTYIKNM